MRLSRLRVMLHGSALPGISYFCSAHPFPPGEYTVCHPWPWIWPFPGTLDDLSLWNLHPWAWGLSHNTASEAALPSAHWSRSSRKLTPSEQSSIDGWHQLVYKYPSFLSLGWNNSEVHGIHCFLEFPCWKCVSVAHQISGWTVYPKSIAFPSQLTSTSPPGSLRLLINCSHSSPISGSAPGKTQTKDPFEAKIQTLKQKLWEPVANLPEGTYSWDQIWWHSSPGILG